jgi:hypothetical protein
MGMAETSLAQGANNALRGELQLLTSEPRIDGIEVSER